MHAQVYRCCIYEISLTYFASDEINQLFFRLSLIVITRSAVVNLELLVLQLMMLLILLQLMVLLVLLQLMMLLVLLQLKLLVLLQLMSEPMLHVALLLFANLTQVSN